MAKVGYFEQAEQSIKLLLAEDKFQEAHDACLLLLKKFPEETKFIKLKTHIEERIHEGNEKIVKTKLKELKPLFKEEKYVELLKNLRPLFKLTPHNEELKRLMLKTQENYQIKIQKQQEKFDKEETEKLNDLLGKDEQSLMDELLNLESNNPGNKKIQMLTAQFRDKLIQKKIKEKQELIYSDKYDAISNFLSQLRKIDKKNKRVLDLEKFTKISQHGSQIDATGEFVYNAHQHLLTLMKLKKYDKAIQVAMEILEVDQKNKKIHKILQTAKRKFFKQTKEASIDSIYQNLETLKNEYNQDKTKFVKI